MYRGRAIFLLINIFLHDVLAVHYWRISDDGKKIESVADSPFSLAHPGSLVEFMRQMENVNDFGKSYTDLRVVLDSITTREKQDEPDIEGKMRKTNKNCIAAYKHNYKLSPESFHSAYSIELCADFHKSYEKYITFIRDVLANLYIDNEDIKPRCRLWHPTGKIFDGKMDHLFKEGNLPPDDVPEPKYLPILDQYFSYFVTYSKVDKEDLYAKMLVKILSHPDAEVSKVPYVHMATAAYWRVKGDLGAAFECYRSAAYYNKKGDDVAKLTSATLEVAASSLVIKVDESMAHSFLLRSPQIPSQYSSCVGFMTTATSADMAGLTSIYHSKASDGSYAVDYSILPKMFIEALTVLYDEMPKDRKTPHIEEIFDELKIKKYAMDCHVAMLEVLTTQKENLDNLVSEKLYYNQRFDEQVTIGERIQRRMASPKTRSNQKIFYETLKYGLNPYAKCKDVLSTEGHHRRVCDYVNEEQYENYFANERKKTLKNRPPLNDTAYKVAEVFARDKSYDKKLEKCRNKPHAEPQLSKKYPLSSASLSSVKDRFWRRADWPNRIDCEAIISKSDLFSSISFPQVYLSPENKGFLISDYLTKFIGLDANEEHPLPWNDPYCHIDFDINEHEFSLVKGFKKALSLKQHDKYAEPLLKTVLVRLTDRIMEDIEVGQRIKTLMDNNIGPRWLGMNLAALYWRVKGNPREAAKCIAKSYVLGPNNTLGEYMDIPLVQLALLAIKVGSTIEEPDVILRIAETIDKTEPLIPWIRGRFALFAANIDVAIRFFKDSLDADPFDARVAEDLLKIACSGKSSKVAIPSQFPTVCCSPVIQNAVCFRGIGHQNSEQCYVMDNESRQKYGSLIYNRCNGVYTGVSYKTSPYVSVVSPFLPIFGTLPKRESTPFVEDVSNSVQYVETDELPLDYGGADAFFVVRPAEWWTRAKSEVLYEKIPEVEERVDEWEEEVVSDLGEIPVKPLSHLWIKDKSEMLRFDVNLPSVLPSPSAHQINRGQSKFPVPRQSPAICATIKKLSVLMQNQVSTWVSVTAKGEDIEKYVDLRGPVPGIAGLQPKCPNIGVANSSPLLGLDHLPAFALSDQFLFYKPELALTDALKSLGNERDTIDHVAARLHTALLADGMGTNGQQVNWLLCVLSSLYWRVIGDSPRAVQCLRCALHTAPPHMRDVALISLANVCHQAGLLHTALILAGAALSASPNLVAIHFTIANIYASIGDYQRSIDFYYSTLSLQSNFEPAKERIRAIFCHSGETFNKYTPV